MKKFAKLSLVAALAVAGTTASAANLADAIQNVDVSGQFRFRAQENTAGETNTDVEVEVGVKVPVNDNVTAVFKIDTTRNTNDGNTQDADYLDIEDYYFQYVDGALTVLAGQQNIPGRMTDGKQGDGIVALYNAGDFTVGAASFMHNNAAADARLNSVIAMGSAGPVSFQAQYADVEDVLDAYNVKVDANIEGIKVGVEYTETDKDANAEEYSTLKAYVSGSFDMLTATVAYGETGKDGSGSIDQEVEAASELLLWQAGTASHTGTADHDLEVFVVDATLALTDAVSVRAAYLDGEFGTAGTDVTETLGQINYKMSSNLNTYVRFSNLEVAGSEDKERGRVEVKYSF